MKKKMEKAQFQSKLASLVIDYGRQSFAEGLCSGFDSSSVTERLQEAKEKANVDYQKIMEMIDCLELRQGVMMNRKLRNVQQKEVFYQRLMDLIIDYGTCLYAQGSWFNTSL